MFKHLANLVTNYPRWVLALWLLVVGLALPLAVQVAEVLTGQAVAPPGSADPHIQELLATDFAMRSRYEMILVARSDGDRVGTPGFDEPYAGAVASALAEVRSASIQDYRNTSGLPLVSPDGQTTIGLIELDAPSLLEAKAGAKRLRDRFESEAALEFSLSGGPATLLEIEEISERDARRAELFGLPLSLAVLIVAFGALVAAGLPLLVAVASIIISFAVLFLLGQVYTFAVFTQSIVTMIGLATGIDYALLIVNRFREEYRVSLDSREAARVTTLSAGRAVAFSGLTVVLALTALLVPPLPFIQSMGIGSIVVIMVSVSVAVTALPAALALLGHRVNWLKVTRHEPGMRMRGFWRRRAELTMARPWLWVVGGVAFLLLLSLPVLRMQVSDSEERSLSMKTDAGKVAEALSSVGLKGFLNPVDILLDFGEQGFYHPNSVRSLSALSRELGLHEMIGGVFTATSTTLPRLLMFQYYGQQETALASPLADLARATVSDNGRFTLLRVFPTEALTPREGSRLIEWIGSTLDEAKVDAMLGGGFVVDRAWNAVLYRSFPISLALVYLFTLVLLALAFHSIVIPLKAIFLNTLTLGAAYGVITAVFQDGLLNQVVGLNSALGFVDHSAPLFIFAIVFGLSMDYEVFLVARIFEAHSRGRSDREAVASALEVTGGVITSAATVMIIVFSLFIFSEVILIKTLGVGLVVAILLDATLVRVILVPAFMNLAGRWNWWLPKPLALLATKVGMSHD